MKRVVHVLAAAGVVAVGCVFSIGGGAASAKSVSASQALPTVSIGLTGKSITVGGRLQSGAVSITSTTTGVRDAEPTLLRLNPGATFQQAFGAVAAHNGDPNALEPYGAIVFDADAPKGTSTAQTVLTPGTYVALDTEGNNPAKWPRTQFTVTQASSPASLPAANATESSIEFNFRGPTVLHNGSIVRAQNQGYLVHMIDLIGVRNVATGREVMALLRAGKDRQAQKLASRSLVNLLGPASSGARQQEVLQAKPGYYIEACFMDTQDGREHTALGMERLVRVVK